MQSSIFLCQTAGIEPTYPRNKQESSRFTRRKERFSQRFRHSAFRFSVSFINFAQLYTMPYEIQRV